VLEFRRVRKVGIGERGNKIKKKKGWYRKQEKKACEIPRRGGSSQKKQEEKAPVGREKWGSPIISFSLKGPSQKERPIIGEGQN